MATGTSGVGRRGVIAGAALAVSGLAAPALGHGTSRTLRYRPVADLVTLDPVATISTPAYEGASLI